MPKNSGASVKWNELAASQMLSVMIKRPANTFSMIVRRKAPRAAGVSATTVKRGNPGKKISRKITTWTWRLPWELQKLGKFDTKTSSWVKTSADIRKFGGALFCDRRYDTVFLFHNGAESYYAARAFRGSLRV
jgi:hypothetical protein